MLEWLRVLRERLTEGVPVVRVAVATVRGSAPREPGATLLCWRGHAGGPAFWGTIGGGQLESRAREIASEVLAEPAPARRAEKFSLGATLGQCCGGAVELFWERFDPATGLVARLASDDGGASLRYCPLDEDEGEHILRPEDALAGGWPPLREGQRAGIVRRAGRPYFLETLDDPAVPVWLYGAGHVGTALVRVLTELPFRIQWIDSREGWLTARLAALARPNLTGRVEEAPEDAVGDAPAGAWHVVMTHSHDQDLRICEAVLKRGDFGFLGLIGSRRKAQRFRHRLVARGIGADMVNRLVCPVGLSGIGGKEPGAVAIAIAAQLLQRRAGQGSGWNAAHAVAEIGAP